MALGQTATDTFTYIVTDNHGASSTATASITVIGQNDAPVIQTGGGGDEATYWVRVNNAASYGQHTAERLHGRARRTALAEDLRVNRILGFAGTE